MLKDKWMTLIATVMLMPAAAVADDVNDTNVNDESSPYVTRSVTALLEGMMYASRWKLSQPVEAIAYEDASRRLLDDVNFVDNSALSRVRKLRGLSLLTLADVGKSRLYLGVNKDGLVGLHFNISPRYDDERYFEMVRMPYLY